VGTISAYGPNAPVPADQVMDIIWRAAYRSYSSDPDGVWAINLFVHPSLLLDPASRARTTDDDLAIFEREITLATATLISVALTNLRGVAFGVASQGGRRRGFEVDGYILDNETFARWVRLRIAIDREGNLESLWVYLISSEEAHNNQSTPGMWPQA